MPGLLQISSRAPSSFQQPSQGVSYNIDLPPPAESRHAAQRREKIYIFSSHLGLIRCLTPFRVSAIIYSQAFLDKHRNTTNIILPHKLDHGCCMLPKQP